VVSEINESRASNGTVTAANNHAPPPFYRKRRLIYAGMLLFVVVAGLPIVGVPYLRNRLSTRVMALKTAMAGDIKPVVAQVGANKEPFPSEYESPAAPLPQAPQLPPVERIFAMTQEGQIQVQTLRSEPRATHRTLRIPVIPPASTETQAPTEQAATAPPAAEESDLKYQQGKVEQDAYDLLLKSNATVAGMVQGSNPSLHFKSWDVASRGEDTYWVRLTFQSEGNPDVEYIWQVKLQAKQVAPLNYNARNLTAN
jgi:hypothetical protein